MAEVRASLVDGPGALVDDLDAEAAAAAHDVGTDDDDRLPKMKKMKTLHSKERAGISSSSSWILTSREYYMRMRIAAYATHDVMHGRTHQDLY